jgi:hypothetical protein
MLAPPPAYDNLSAGRLIENSARNMNERTEFCFPHPEADRALGCSARFVHSLDGSVRCYLHRSKSYLQRYGTTAEAVRRHEIAHCNGCPGSHPW